MQPHEVLWAQAESLEALAHQARTEGDRLWRESHRPRTETVYRKIRRKVDGWRS